MITKKILLANALILVLTATSTPVVLAQGHLESRTKAPNREEQLKLKDNQVKQRLDNFKTQTKKDPSEVKRRIQTDNNRLDASLESAGIKDKRKRQIVKRASKSFNDFNQKTTDRWLRGADRIEPFIKRIAARVNRVELDGVDVSSTQTAVESLLTSFGQTRQEVADQGNKVYSVPDALTRSGPFKNNILNLRDQIKADLTALQIKIDRVLEQIDSTVAILKRDLQNYQSSLQNSDASQKTGRPVNNTTGANATLEQGN